MQFLTTYIPLKVFLAVLLAYLTAQIIKVIIWTYKEKRFSFSLILRRANMPSAHSATVGALTTAVYLTEGLTTLTVAVFIFSVIVIRDALDVNLGIPKQSKKISQERGYIHTPSEVFIGIIIGIMMAILII